MKKASKVQKTHLSKKNSTQTYEKPSPVYTPFTEKALCPRCDGLMVKEYFFDYRDDSGKLAFLAFRCILCGEIIDPIIMKNRKHRPNRRQIQRSNPVTILRKTHEEQEGA